MLPPALIMQKSTFLSCFQHNSEAQLNTIFDRLEVALDETLEYTRRMLMTAAVPYLFMRLISGFTRPGARAILTGFDVTKMGQDGLCRRQ
jgi:hypothetical protein